MIKLGIIGVSEGNGHPYSFSAIINGYNDEFMSKSGWANIYSYLKKRDISDFGIFDAKVTHIWTQDIKESKKIAKCCYIENVVDNFEDMINEVDGIIIARDDYDKHLYFAKPFLEADKYVFIDKPLSLCVDDLAYFKPFLKDNKLFSASGVRYAPELDELRANIHNFGKIKLIRGTIIKDWEKYAIHMLDAIFSVVKFDVESVLVNRSMHESFCLFCKDGKLIEIDTLGKSMLTLRVEFFSDQSYYRADTLNAFDSFRRLLWHFINMIKNGRNSIDYNLTINLMKVLIAGKVSKKENREVFLNEIKV